MENRIYDRLLALVFAMGLLLAPGCGDARKARRKARRAQKVDCVRLCTRSFQKCALEVVVATGRLKPERVDALKAAGVFAKFQTLGYEACLRDCNKKQGSGSDAARINDCLAQKGCMPFADCIKKVIQ
jgi:hypothetical protein